MEKAKKRINGKKMALFLLGAIAALFVLIKLVPAGISLIFGHSISQDCITITPDAISNYDFDIYKNQIALFNSQGLKTYNYKGEYQWDIPAKVYDPYLDTNGNYAILADIDGGEIQHVSGDTVDFVIRTSQPIQKAAVSSDGYVAVVTSEKGYKSLVSVYDNKGEEIYKWYSGEIYVVDAQIAPDHKKMAVVGIDTSKNNLSSVVMFFDLSSDNPTAQVILDNSLAYQLVYAGQDVVVLTDHALKLIKNSGEIKAEYDFSGRSLHAFDLENTSKMVLALSQKDTDNSANSQIVVLNEKLKQTASNNLPVQITMLDERNGAIAAGGQRKLYVLTTGGRIKASGDMVKDAKYIKLTSDKKHIVTLSGSLVNIYQIKLGR